MSDTSYIALLVSTNATLVGALVWLVRAERKERREVIDQNSRLLTQCMRSIDENTKVLSKVLDLLTNWRGH